MTDLAPLGFSVDPDGSLERGDRAIRRIVGAAELVDRALGAAEAAAGAFGRRMSSFATANSAAARSATEMARAMASVAAAVGSNALDNAARAAQTGSAHFMSLAVSAGRAANTISQMTEVLQRQASTVAGNHWLVEGQRLDALRARYNPVFAAIRNYQQQVLQIKDAHLQGAISANEMAAAISRIRRSSLESIAALKQQTAAVQSLSSAQMSPHGQNGQFARYQVPNIAAQFQDIGVTAAMGMNPLMIALQQGTQLSAIFGPMGATGALRGFSEALKSVFSPFSLLIIAITAAVAAAIQFVNWTKTAQTVLEGAASLVRDFGEEITVAGGVLAVAFGPAAVGVVAKLTAAIGVGLLGAVKATWALAAAHPFTAIALALAAAAVAAYQFRDEITEAIGPDVIAAFKNTGNTLIAIFKTVFDEIRAQFEDLLADFQRGPSTLMSRFGNNVTGAARQVLGISGEAFRRLGVENDITAENNFLTDFFGRASSRPDRPSISDRLRSNLDRDFMGEIGGGATRTLSTVENWLTKLSKSLNTLDKDAQKAAKAYEGIVQGARDHIAAQQLEIAAFGMSEQAADKLRITMELLNAARDADIKLIPEQIAELEKLAAQQAEVNEALRAAERADEARDAYSDMIADANEYIASQKLEQEAMGLTTQAAATLRHEYDLYLKAMQNNIALTPQMVTSIRQIASEMGAADAATEAAQKSLDEVNENMDVARSATKGFFSDLYNGAKQGKSAIDLLTDALMNFLDRLVDRGIDRLVDLIFPEDAGRKGTTSADPMSWLKGVVSAARDGGPVDVSAVPSQGGPSVVLAGSAAVARSAGGAAAMYPTESAVSAGASAIAESTETAAESFSRAVDDWVESLPGLAPRAVRNGLTSETPRLMNPDALAPITHPSAQWVDPSFDRARWEASVASIKPKHFESGDFWPGTSAYKDQSRLGSYGNPPAPPGPFTGNYQNHLPPELSASVQATTQAQQMQTQALQSATQTQQTAAQNIESLATKATAAGTEIEAMGQKASAAPAGDGGNKFDDAFGMFPNAGNDNAVTSPLETSLSSIQNSATTFAGGFQNVLGGLVGNMGGIGQNFVGMFSSVLQNIVGGLGGGGGGGIGSALGGVLSIVGGLFANGAAFSNGRVTAFARGGVVTGPTLFPMANGMGLMGEAGAEAVMPLRRGPSGRLGVEMHGSSMPDVRYLQPIVEVVMDGEGLTKKIRYEAGGVAREEADRVREETPSMVDNRMREKDGRRTRPMRARRRAA